MEYTQKTADLISEMCRISERKDFKLEKKKAEETILKTYDLFNLPRPKKIVWFKDLTKEFLDSASSAYRASSASSASSAYRASIDYDFDWFVLTYEYNQSEKDGNKNDKKYLEYCNILLEAKKLGLGYWCDFEDVIYLVPTPIVSIDERNNFHSLKSPAVYWKGGEENYFIRGVKLDKALWKKIVSGKMSAEEVFAIENTEQRRVAYELMDKSKMKKLKNFKIVDEVKDNYGYPMKVVEFELKGFDSPFRYLNCFCSSTGREYFVETRQETAEKAKAKSFGLEEVVFTKEW